MRPALRAIDMLNKVPEITLIFWLIKILSTTVGETGADYLAVHVGLGTALDRRGHGGTAGRGPRPANARAALRALDLLADRCADQRRRHPDHRRADGRAGDQPLYSARLSSLRCSPSFLPSGTRSSERFRSTRSSHSGASNLYWWAILFTFALGTAAGDLATEALASRLQSRRHRFWRAHLAVVAAAYALGANPVLTFWIAYILTRPLGASLGDMLAQAREYGGLGFGTVYTSARLS